MFGQTITIYNKRYDPATKQTYWPKTVIHGVSWSGQRRVTTGDGLTSNDGYSVRIPVEAMPDGYAPRDKYVTLADPLGYWTAQAGDVVVLGEGPDANEGVTGLTKQFTESFAVIAVHAANMARVLPHLRIEGK